MAQTLRNMRGHSTIAYILIILASLTKALFALQKLWRLGTPLLPSMLTITLSQFQTSKVFFLNNSQLVYTFILCFCSSPCFYFTLFEYILSFHMPFLSFKGCRLTAESSLYILKHFLARELFYLLSIYHYYYFTIAHGMFLQYFYPLHVQDYLKCT